MLFLKKKGFVFCAAFGVMLSAVLCMLLLLLAAFLIYKEMLGQEMGTAAACVSAGGGVFMASTILSRLRGRQALAMGAALPAAFLFLAMLIRLCAGGSSALGSWLLWLAVAVFAGGLLGAVLAAGKGANGKRRYKRRR